MYPTDRNRRLDNQFFVLNFVVLPNFPDKMRHVTIYTTDKEYSHFVELARNLHYVKRIETDDEPTKADVVDNIKTGLEEVRLFKEGKLSTTPAKSFLDEL